MAVFVDTNVLVYARDTSEREKRERCAAWLERLWDTGEGRLSFQVLSEYYAVVTRKLDPGLTRAQARMDVHRFMTWSPWPVDAVVLEAAWAVEERHSLSYWDALVVATAQLAGCEALVTEDLTHGLELDGLRVLNPFVTSPEEIV